MLEQIQFVLINTTHPGNIGATARAMKTMGMARLSLVGPARFPSAEATAMASGGDDLLQHATVSESLDEVLADCSLILGTSARPRGLPIETLDPRQAAHLALQAAEEGQQVALLFGRERYGLTNDELKRCQKAVYIPSNPEFSSLNLAQAVQVLAYEFRMAHLQSESAGSGLDLEQSKLPIALPEGARPPRYRPATDRELEGYFAHLEETLVQVRFIKSEQRSRMMLRLRRLYQRAELDTNDINILRGILSATQKEVSEMAHHGEPQPRPGSD